MNKLAGIVLSALALITSITLGYLYFSYDDSDDSSVLENMESIFELQQIDAAWSLATMQTLSTPNSDFDKVAAFLPRFRKLRNQLSNSELADSQAPAPLKNKLLAFLSLLEGKEQAIEQFKSNLAITRNSVKYLPLATRTLSEKAKKIKDNKLAMRIQDLDRLTNSYLKTPDNDSKIQVLNNLTELEQQLMELPADIVNPLGNFISHARVLIEHKVPMNEIVTRVTSNNASKTGSELIALYKTYGKRIAKARSDRKAEYNLYSLITTVILMLIALVAGVYTFISGIQYNKQLKSEVLARTSELEQKANAATDSIVDGHHGKSMDTMGDLVATLAHELNTPLGYIASNLELLQSGTSKFNLLMDELESLNSALDESEIEKLRTRVSTFIDTISATREQAMLDEFPGVVNDISDGIVQIQHVIQELKDFSRKDRLEKEWFDLNKCIENALKMSKHQIRDDINIIKKLGELPQIHGSQADMNQVIINLINNASLAITEADRSPGIIKLTTALMKGVIVMDIQDNGIGMSNDVVSKIFDPFFTTRDVGKGTGLGLAIVQKIIKQNNGKVFVKSESGKGTLFRLTLPVTAEN